MKNRNNLPITYGIANKGFCAMQRFAARFNSWCNLIGNRRQYLIVYTAKR